jgi:hypothetical protein
MLGKINTINCFTICGHETSGGAYRTALLLECPGVPQDTQQDGRRDTLLMRGTRGVTKMYCAYQYQRDPEIDQ